MKKRLKGTAGKTSEKGPQFSSIGALCDLVAAIAPVGVALDEDDEEMAEAREHVKCMCASHDCLRELFTMSRCLEEAINNLHSDNVNMDAVMSSLSQGVDVHKLAPKTVERLQPLLDEFQARRSFSVGWGLCRFGA